MRVRWSSTHDMLKRAYELKDVSFTMLICSFSVSNLCISFYLKLLKFFIFETAAEESDVNKRTKLTALNLTDEEWGRVKQVIEILGVRTLFFNLVNHLLIISYSCPMWLNRPFPTTPLHLSTTAYRCLKVSTRPSALVLHVPSLQSSRTLSMPRYGKSKTITKSQQQVTPTPLLCVRDCAFLSFRRTHLICHFQC